MHYNVVKYNDFLIFDENSMMKQVLELGQPEPNKELSVIVVMLVGSCLEFTEEMRYEQVPY